MSSPIRVGVVGAGQLARMMAETAAAVGVEIVLLATSHDDVAVALAHQTIIGQPTSLDALRELSRHCDVITFDHELVSLPALAELEAEGVAVRPSAATLAYSVDKAIQRQRFEAAGLPVPRFLVITDEHDDRIEDFLHSLPAPPVVKTATGGYDGRGVVIPDTLDECRSAIAERCASGTVVLEERVALQMEVAQMVVRSVAGDIALYPVVTTVQVDGMCTEVHYPTILGDERCAQASVLTAQIAELVDLVGVMAVEYFVTPEGLWINELAIRPHNSGHWTIEGCATSQFANHLLAVSGQTIGDTSPIVANAVMVNVVGGPTPGSIELATAVPGAFVHDYGKSWRPGRKLGHVTAVGDDFDAAEVTAWKSARAYGTESQETL